MDMFRAHAEEIAAYQEDPSIPSGRVETLLDAAHALMFHRSRVLGRKRETLREQKNRLIVARRGEPGEWDHLMTREERKRPPLDLERIPLEPDEDLLRFLAEYAPLQDWERRVLEIVAQESDYFTPNIMTKVMNEGWATYWHDRIFHALPDRPPASSTSSMPRRCPAWSCPATLRLNPYHIGWHIWKDIYRRWETPSEEDRDNWGRPGGEGCEKLFEVRDTEHDASFIANYLTDELIAELKLFRYQWVGRVRTASRSTGPRRARRGRLRAHPPGGHDAGGAATAFPCSASWTPTTTTTARSMIEHVHDGRDLKIFEPELPLRDLRTILKEKREPARRGRRSPTPAKCSSTSGRSGRTRSSCGRSTTALRCWSAATGTGKRAWNCSIDFRECSEAGERRSR